MGTYDMIINIHFTRFTDAQRKSSSIDDGRSSSHSTQQRRSPGNALKRPRYLVDGGGSRTSLKSNGDDEDTLRQLLNE